MPTVFGGVRIGLTAVHVDRQETHLVHDFVLLGVVLSKWHHLSPQHFILPVNRRGRMIGGVQTTKTIARKTSNFQVYFYLSMCFFPCAGDTWYRSNLVLRDASMGITPKSPNDQWAPLWRRPPTNPCIPGTLSGHWGVNLDAQMCLHSSFCTGEADCVSYPGQQGWQKFHTYIIQGKNTNHSYNLTDSWRALNIHMYDHHWC